MTDLFALDLPQSRNRFEQGQELWAVYSTGEPAVWIYGKVTCQERSGRFRVSISADGTRELPIQLAHAASPAQGLRPGSPVTVHAEGSARFGRIQSISGDKLRVKYAVGYDTIKDGDFTTTDVRPFRRRALDPGAPVLFSGGGRSFIGVLAMATGQQAYVICGDLLELARTEVTPLDTSKLLKPGDRVVVVPPDAEGCEAIEGQVVEMKNAGMQYEVELARGGEVDAPFGLVALHPSLPRPSAP